MTLDVGIHQITMAEYLADPCPEPSLSASIAHTLVTQCPSHAWALHPRGGARRGESTSAMAKGTLLDSILLGGDAEIVEVPVDDWRTKAAKELRDAALAAGKLPVKTADLASARSAADQIRFKLSQRGVNLDGENQLTVIWKEGGVYCRGRLDHWDEKNAIIYDLKKTANAQAGAFARSVHSFGYDIQNAAYISAIETLRPELAGRVKMKFLACEVDYPYEVAVYPLAGSMRALGSYRWRKAVNSWAACLANKRFPGYEDCELEAGPWMLTEMTDSLDGGSDGIPF